MKKEISVYQGKSLDGGCHPISWKIIRITIFEERERGANVFLGWFLNVQIPL